ncbi:alpha/beta fold hydrolase [Ramlibacter rhizophilus]|uniref:Alpha/beta hydrolase n=1 Tax=Ramlibacter rhizophilus TaxID=1781167 RepID=A0A4Z0BFA1_9BURK|nr:alpha/beta hydrolase [Ramlibacter rhizophilus]TFY96804.1 alpha/beta hydrolase [Ramlibacter rhizophilus]
MTEPRLHHVNCQSAAGPHRMAYWLWGDAQAPQVVVCVHGLSRQGRDFDVLARRLVDAAGGTLRVACPDVVGRGHSDWLRDPSLYQLPTYASDMLVLLTALDAAAPVAWFDWVGTSMGGLIGMAVCGTPHLPLPAPVRRLVLNDVGPVIQWQALQRIGSYLGQGGRYDTLQHAADAMAAISVGFGPHSREQWLALSQPMVRALPEGGFALHYDPAIAQPLRALRQEDAAQGEAALWALYDQIRAETLLLRGTESDLLSHETALAMTQRGPRARLIEIPGVGHAPTLVTPQQVNPLVDFLLHEERKHEKPGERGG